MSTIQRRTAVATTSVLQAYALANYQSVVSLKANRDWCGPQMEQNQRSHRSPLFADSSKAAQHPQSNTPKLQADRGLKSHTPRMVPKLELDHLIALVFDIVRDDPAMLGKLDRALQNRFGSQNQRSEKSNATSNT